MRDKWKWRRLYLTRVVRSIDYYWKKRLVIFKENRVGGRARVTIDEERVLWQGWTEMFSYVLALKQSVFEADRLNRRRIKIRMLDQWETRGEKQLRVLT